MAQQIEDLTAIPGEIVEPKKTRKQKREENRKILYETIDSEHKSVKETADDVLPEVINGGRGRPTTYTPELAARLCAQLAAGKSIRTACKAADMPSIATVYNWMNSNPEFLEQYARAKQDAADAMAEDIMDIADDSTNDYMEYTYGDQTVTRLNQENIQRSKLRIETRRWLMSKYKPKRYGDKLDLTHSTEALPIPLLGSLTRTEYSSDDINDDNGAAE